MPKSRGRLISSPFPIRHSQKHCMVKPVRKLFSALICCKCSGTRCLFDWYQKLSPPTVLEQRAMEIVNARKVSHMFAENAGSSSIWMKHVEMWGSRFAACPESFRLSFRIYFRKSIAFSVTIESRWSVGTGNVSVLSGSIKDSTTSVGVNR